MQLSTRPLSLSQASIPRGNERLLFDNCPVQLTAGLCISPHSERAGQIVPENEKEGMECRLLGHR